MYDRENSQCRGSYHYTVGLVTILESLALKMSSNDKIFEVSINSSIEKGDLFTPPGE